MAKQTLTTPSIMTNKPIILAIVGASRSGKTSLSLFLQHRLNIPTIVSYTTRPMREGEVDGVDHIFVGIEDCPDFRDTFASTIFGGYHYWTTPAQFEGKSIMSYVVDEKGLQDLQDSWSDKYTIISILVKRSNNPTEAKRQERDRNRNLNPEDSYDVVLENNATIQEFYRQAILKIGEKTALNRK